jgi:hypothetical protein
MCRLIVLKSGSLNLLELSVPAKACNEIILPLISPLWDSYREKFPRVQGSYKTAEQNGQLVMTLVRNMLQRVQDGTTRKWEMGRVT